MQPTAEQTHILDLAKTESSNIIIRALAGTGKTSTLEMVEKVVKEKPICYLVFNKRNADEAAKKMAPTTTVRTMNALGHRIWAKVATSSLDVNPKKSNDILKGIIDDTPKDAQGPIWDSFGQITQGVALAKALGYIPPSVARAERSLLSQNEFHNMLEEDPDDLVAALIDEVLVQSIVASYKGHIDYNDQVYMPALFGGTYPQFPLVLVDEAQDLSPTNHAILHKLCTNSRIIAVGDPFQNIYGFRGAKAGSMSNLQIKYAMSEADLSISFRCPSEIVKNAQWRVPHFKWFTEGGHVEIIDQLDPSSMPEHATIICRNNAPLLAAAFKFLAAGRSVNVAGSDIGPRLLGIMRKLGPEELTQGQTVAAIDEWLEVKLEKNSKTASEMAECMKVFAAHGTTLGLAIKYAEHLFNQTGNLYFTTGHKAKGLEWKTVYHLDPWILDQREQDLNLRYVIQTRSRDRYYEIESGRVKW